ncbi:hypothetical protein HK096_001254, partial [Nowakowskiella sp. JEL0078]
MIALTFTQFIKQSYGLIKTENEYTSRDIYKALINAHVVLKKTAGQRSSDYIENPIKGTKKVLEVKKKQVESTAICYNCLEKGHFIPNCKEVRKSSEEIAANKKSVLDSRNAGTTWEASKTTDKKKKGLFFYRPDGHIHKEILLLDSCATIHCTGDKSLLHDFESTDSDDEIVGLNIDAPSSIAGYGSLVTKIQYRGLITKVIIKDVAYIPTMDSSDIILSHGVLERECHITANFTNRILNRLVNNVHVPVAELLLLENNLYAIRTPEMEAETVQKIYKARINKTGSPK